MAALRLRFVSRPSSKGVNFVAQGWRRPGDLGGGWWHSSLGAIMVAVGVHRSLTCSLDLLGCGRCDVGD
jgi:hypothetical protein